MAFKFFTAKRILSYAQCDPDRRAGTMRGRCIAVAYSEILYRKLYSDVMYTSPRWTVYETLWRL